MEDYSVFKRDSWSVLSLAKKRIALQNLEKNMAKKQHRDAKKIVVKLLEDNVWGRYKINATPTSKVLQINKKYVTSKDDGVNYGLMATVIHEGRHAQQEGIIKGYATTDYPGDETIKLWIINSMVGDNSQGSSVQYHFQPLDNDAHNYAYEQMDLLLPQFEGEDDYRFYMEGQKSRRDYLETKALKFYEKYYQPKDYKQAIMEGILFADISNLLIIKRTKKLINIKLKK